MPERKVMFRPNPWPRPGLSVVEHPTEESHQGRQVGPKQIRTPNDLNKMLGM